MGRVVSLYAAIFMGCQMSLQKAGIIPNEFTIREVIVFLFIEFQTAEWKLGGS